MASGGVLRAERERIGEHLDGILRSSGVPGAVLGVFADGEEWLTAAGRVTVDRGRVTSSTPFMIGSITKVLTGLAVMEQVSAGRIALDDPIVTHLPELGAEGRRLSRVTVRHAMSHTSGIDGDLMIDTGEGDNFLAAYASEIAAVELLHEPGALFSYSNASYCVLGALIERVSHASFVEVVGRLTADLGIRARFDRQQIPGAAMGHRLVDGSPVTTDQRLPASMQPAGAATWMTGADLLGLGRRVMEGALGSGPAPVANLASMAQRAAKLPALNDTAAAIGLTFFLDEWSGQRVLSHAGGTAGYAAALHVLPDLGVVTCLLTNCRGARAWPAVRDLIFDDVLGLDPRRLPPTPSQPHELNPVDYIGTYLRHAQHLTVEAAPNGRSLRLRRGTDRPVISDLIALDGDRFLDVPANGPAAAVTFQRTSDNQQITHMYAGVRLAPKVARHA